MRAKQRRGRRGCLDGVNGHAHVDAIKQVPRERIRSPESPSADADASCQLGGTAPAHTLLCTFHCSNTNLQCNLVLWNLAGVRSKGCGVLNQGVSRAGRDVAEHACVLVLGVREIAESSQRPQVHVGAALRGCQESEEVRGK